MTTSADHREWLPPSVSTYTDDAGHQFGFVHVRHPASVGIGVHFSAFYSRFGVTRAHKPDFGGYFHRLRMLGSCDRHDWLFLCDPFGAFDNGTYYTGHRGDLFVERGIEEIWARVVHPNYDTDQVVTVGSSMGATAALKFGLRHHVAGIVAISPHIDLDTSARLQNRHDEVAWVLPDCDIDAEHNRSITRQIRHELAQRSSPPPRLFVQSCLDDDGVHNDQVVPLVRDWSRAGGEAVLDFRDSGGHTSAFATRPLLLDAVDAMMAGRSLDIARYQCDPTFAGIADRITLNQRIRRRLEVRRRSRDLRDRLLGGRRAA